MPGSCPANWLHGKTDDAEAAVLVGLLQLLESFVLRRQAALGGDVDDEDGLAGEGRQRTRLAVEGVQGDVVDGHGATLTGSREDATRRRLRACAASSSMRGSSKSTSARPPNPGPLDVIVAVRGAGINAADLMQRDGHYPAPEGWPVDVPGHGTRRRRQRRR